MIVSISDLVLLTLVLTTSFTPLLLQLFAPRAMLLAGRRPGAAHTWMALAVFLASLFIGAAVIPTVLVLLMPSAAAWFAAGPIIVNLPGLQLSAVSFILGGLIAFPVLIFLARRFHTSVTA